LSEVEISLHRYRMPDGFSSIGITGPITWSFIGDDLRGFTMAEVKRLYAGWYIAFFALRSAGYSLERNQRERKALAQELGGQEAGFVRVREYLAFGELVSTGKSWRGPLQAVRVNSHTIVARDA
jgi:hypothetical protein